MSTSSASKRVGAARRGDHVCAVFDSDAQQQDVLTGFVRDGLAADDRVWCLTDALPPEGVLDLLRAGEVPVDDAMAAGRLVVRSAAESYLAEPPFDPDRMITIMHDAVDQALADGFAGFRLTGDMSWAARGVLGADRLLDYERRVSEVFATRPAAALCQYDRRRFDAATLAGALEAHPHMLVPTTQSDGLTVGRLPDRVGLRLDGEIDMANRDDLQRAVASLPPTSTQIHFELAGLRFIDAAGYVELLAAVGTDPARRLVLHDPRGTVRRLIELLRPGCDMEVRYS